MSECVKVCGLKVGKWWENGGFTQRVVVSKKFAQSFTILIHGVLHEVLHGISTLFIVVGLVIDFLLDFGDLIAEDKIETEVLVDLLDAMHDGGVVLDADFGGDFGGTEAEFLG